MLNVVYQNLGEDETCCNCFESACNDMVSPNATGKIRFVVISLKGALLLTEVMKERDAQVELKNMKKNWEKEKDQYLYQLQQRVSFFACVWI